MKSEWNPHWLNVHIEKLKQLNISQDLIYEFIADHSTYARLEMSHFAMYCWNGVAKSNLAPGWLQRTISQRKENRSEKDVLDFYDELSPNYENVTDALQRLKSCGVSEKDLLMIIRESQKTTLANIIQTLDGGTGAKYHICETYWKNGEYHAGRPFCDMEDLFLLFEPRDEYHSS